jgi:hypothetical protein
MARGVGGDLADDFFRREGTRWWCRRSWAWQDWWWPAAPHAARSRIGFSCAVDPSERDRTCWAGSCLLGRGLSWCGVKSDTSMDSTCFLYQYQILWTFGWTKIESHFSFKGTIKHLPCLHHFLCLGLHGGSGAGVVLLGLW